VRDSAVKSWSRIHRLLYRLTGGFVGRRLVDNDMLLLTTTGRVSGRAHTVPLLFLRDGKSLMVIASYGGRDGHPEWYLNLVRQPVVHAQIRGDHLDLLARTASGTERREWWPRVVEAFDGYAVYQSRTEREIPVVILDPVDASIGGRILDEHDDR